MKVSKYQQKKITKEKSKAVNLYKTGLTTRQVGDILGRSHTWVQTCIKLSTI
jgi:hypothetical protein